MNDPLKTLPKYFQKHFYLGVVIVFIAVIAKTIIWLFKE